MVVGMFCQAITKRRTEEAGAGAAAAAVEEEAAMAVAAEAMSAAAVEAEAEAEAAVMPAVEVMAEEAEVLVEVEGRGGEVGGGEAAAAPSTRVLVSKVCWMSTMFGRHGASFTPWLALQNSR